MGPLMGPDASSRLSTVGACRPCGCGGHPCRGRRGPPKDSAAIDGRPAVSKRNRTVSGSWLDYRSLAVSSVGLTISTCTLDRRSPGVYSDSMLANFADTFERAHVDGVTLFAKCHDGHLYYDNRPPEPHPGLAPGLNLRSARSNPFSPEVFGRRSASVSSAIKTPPTLIRTGWRSPTSQSSSIWPSATHPARQAAGSCLHCHSFATSPTS